MVLRLFYFSFVLFLLGSFAVTEKDKNLIYWEDRKVSWEDFKGRAPSSTPYVAMTWSAIRFGYSGEGYKLNISVHTVFDPKQSWKKKNVDDYILKHEQGHFDITEIHSRMLRKKIKEYRFNKYEKIPDDLQKMFNDQFKECDKMQDDYDDETDHSKKKKEQLLWDNQIDSLLNSLNDFTQTEFVLDLSYLE